MRGLLSAFAGLTLLGTAQAVFAAEYVVLRCVATNSTFTKPIAPLGTSYYRRVGMNYWAKWDAKKQMWSDNLCNSRYQCRAYPAFYEITIHEPASDMWSKPIVGAKPDDDGWVRAYRYMETGVVMVINVNRNTAALDEVQAVKVGRSTGRLNEDLGQFRSDGNFESDVEERRYEEHDPCAIVDDPANALPAAKF